MLKLLCYPECSTCRKARKWLDEKQIPYELRDIKTENPNEEELGAWYRRSGLPLRKFFNTSGLVYRAMDLKSRLPEMTKAEMLSLLASDGMLVRRPLVIGEEVVLVGFQASEWEAKLR